jgi:hypothetical protein
MPQFKPWGAQGSWGQHGIPLPSSRRLGKRRTNVPEAKQILPCQTSPAPPDAYAYGALETNDKSPVFRLRQRAYFISNETGTVKYIKVMDNLP